ncbi:hypothetical protein ACQEU3_43330 [Spirillospora sp. CA-253888]
MGDSDPVRRLCAAVSAPAGTGHRPLAEVVRQACRTAGLDRLFLQRRASDGGRSGSWTMVLALPAGAHEARVISDLVHWLHEAVTRREPSPAGPLRLAVAFDQGLTRLDADGFEGPAITAVCAMSTDERTWAALAAPGPGVAVVLSAALVDDLAPPHPGDRDLTGFESLAIALPGRRVAAWLHPPGRRFQLPGPSCERW